MPCQHKIFKVVIVLHSSRANWYTCFLGPGPPSGGENRGYFPGAPKHFSRKGAPWFNFYNLHFTFLGYIFTRCFFFFHFLLHCLDSMSECLGRIIRNAFMVSVDKYFDACKYAEPTLLTNWSRLLWRIFALESFPQGPFALSAALSGAL